MSLTTTNSPRVVCLTCNSKVEISSSKNIYKTTFTHTGESLAPFVSSTLSLPDTKFRSSYLCLQCLNLFGKLEAASRKVKSIKSEIHKVFQDSNKVEITLTIQNAEKDTPTKVKPKAIITQCTQRKSTNTLVQKKTIINSLGLPVISEKKNTFNIVQLKMKSSRVTRINLKTYQEHLESTKPNTEADANTIVSNNEISFDNVDVTPSLKDHQYTQLPITVNKDSIDTTDKHVPSTKVLSIVQQKIAPKKKEKVSEPKKLELPNPESYTCCNCGMKKDTLKDLKVHYKNHAELYPYMCEKCGKVYKTKKSLKIHINTHDRVTALYTCTACNKCFTQKGALKRHLPVHTREKAYECQVCLKKFVHHTSYKMHILVHKEKQHKCDLCPCAFTSLSQLKRHIMRTHSGEKRRSCKICGKRFYEHYNLVAHMKIHDPALHKEAKEKQRRPVQRRCERCKIDFASAGEYNVHLHKHTPENMPSKENEYINGIQVLETKIESTSTS